MVVTRSQRTWSRRCQAPIVSAVRVGTCWGVEWPYPKLAGGPTMEMDESWPNRQGGIAMGATEFTLLPPHVRAFRPSCPGCTPAAVTDVNARPCSYYDCPGLPEELEVTCDVCMYDFVAHDGQPACDHNSCETALRLQQHVPAYRAWLEHLTEEAAGT